LELLFLGALKREAFTIDEQCVQRQTSNRAVVRFYNKRATAEQWIKEGKQAVAMSRLSCHRFQANQVRLWLSLIAYNLGNLWRRLALPREIGNWSLTSLQQRLMKTGGRLIKHARYYWLLLAESHLTRRLFDAMLGKVAALPSCRHLPNSTGAFPCSPYFWTAHRTGRVGEVELRR
jgi:hypothetical protein